MIYKLDKNLLIDSAGRSHELAEVLRSKLDALGKNVDWLADKSKIDRATIYRLFAGELDMGHTRLFRLCQALGIEIKLKT